MRAPRRIDLSTIRVRSQRGNVGAYIYDSPAEYPTTSDYSANREHPAQKRQDSDDANAGTPCNGAARSLNEALGDDSEDIAAAAESRRRARLRAARLAYGNPIIMATSREGHDHPSGEGEAEEAPAATDGAQSDDEAMLEEALTSLKSRLDWGAGVLQQRTATTVVGGEAESVARYRAEAAASEPCQSSSGTAFNYIDIFPQDSSYGALLGAYRYRREERARKEATQTAALLRAAIAAATRAEVELYVTRLLNDIINDIDVFARQAGWEAQQLEQRRLDYINTIEADAREAARAAAAAERAEREAAWRRAYYAGHTLLLAPGAEGACEEMTYSADPAMAALRNAAAGRMAAAASSLAQAEEQQIAELTQQVEQLMSGIPARHYYHGTRMRWNRADTDGSPGASLETPAEGASEELEDATLRKLGSELVAEAALDAVLSCAIDSDDRGSDTCRVASAERPITLACHPISDSLDRPNATAGAISPAAKDSTSGRETSVEQLAQAAGLSLNQPLGPLAKHRLDALRYKPDRREPSFGVPTVPNDKGATLSLPRPAGVSPSTTTSARNSSEAEVPKDAHLYLASLATPAARARFLRGNGVSRGKKGDFHGDGSGASIIEGYYKYLPNDNPFTSQRNPRGTGPLPSVLD